jgi:hypothetical protein
MAYFEEHDSWRSMRVNERELLKDLNGIEKEGKYEVKYILPYRLPVGKEQGDALYTVILRER